MDNDESEWTEAHDDASVNRHETEEHLQIAKKEDKWVSYLKVITALVLLVVSITVCVGVYINGRNSEQDDFEQDFTSLSEKLVTSFEDLIQQRFGALESFAEDITAQANGTWPLVLPPLFKERADTIGRLSLSMLLGFFPIVFTKEEVPAWTEFALANDGVCQSRPAGAEGPAGFPTIMNMHNPNGPTPAVEISDGPYVPSWCFWPESQFGYNVDMYGDAEHRYAMDNTLATGKPTFEKLYDYINSEKDGRYQGLKQNPNVDYQDDGHTVSFFPVFDNLSEDRSVQAFLLVIIYWRTFFNGLLPPGANGVLVILENTCGDQHTYRVDGSDAAFYGFGDLHDPKYDYLGRGASVDSIIQNGVESEAEGCKYSIRVYPSEELEDSYRTDDPWIYATVLGALFLFTVSVFLLYDCVVARRQKIVLESAKQSGAVVSSLFPQAVRNQIYEEQKEKDKAREQRANWTTLTKSSANYSNTKSGNDSTTAYEDKSAIASEYENTTIFFADIAGFTSWSAKRQPCEVFKLLETLYGAFDEIAERRRVFKIETIGDCYVAITGCPNAQNDHASRMVKFARDCLHKMTQLVTELSPTLGEDTATLGFRVGLHSGKVTAGVLRGKKARFQLFGDTVNTASRMESNGVKGRIHVSQATADALIAQGKGSWLEARAEKIVAKGKGEMQTYFVYPNQKATTATSVSSGDEVTASLVSMEEAKETIANVESLVSTGDRVSRVEDTVEANDSDWMLQTSRL